MNTFDERWIKKGKSVGGVTVTAFTGNHTRILYVKAHTPTHILKSLSASGFFPPVGEKCSVLMNIL